MGDPDDDPAPPPGGPDGGQKPAPGWADPTRVTELGFKIEVQAGVDVSDDPLVHVVERRFFNRFRLGEETTVERHRDEILMPARVRETRVGDVCFKECFAIHDVYLHTESMSYQWFEDYEFDMHFLRYIDWIKSHLAPGVEFNFTSSGSVSTGEPIELDRISIASTQDRDEVSRKVGEGWAERAMKPAKAPQFLRHDGYVWVKCGPEHPCGEVATAVDNKLEQSIVAVQVRDADTGQDIGGTLTVLKGVEVERAARGLDVTQHSGEVAAFLVGDLPGAEVVVAHKPLPEYRCESNSLQQSPVTTIRFKMPDLKDAPKFYYFYDRKINVRSTGPGTPIPVSVPGPAKTDASPGGSTTPSGGESGNAPAGTPDATPPPSSSTIPPGGAPAGTPGGAEGGLPPPSGSTVRGGASAGTPDDPDGGLPPPSKSTAAPGGTSAGTPGDMDDGLPPPSKSAIPPGGTDAGAPDDIDDGLPPPSRSTIVPRTTSPRLPIATVVAIAGALIVSVILIATGVIPTGLSANRPVGGGSGKHVQFFLQGHITSRSGCQGEYYSAAPKVGESGNFLGEMWLVGGVLYGTDTSSSNSLYRGSLHNDGSFQLVWTQATPNGEKQRIDAVITTNGRNITGTYDTVFLSGCLLHLKIDQGDLLSNATIGTLRG